MATIHLISRDEKFEVADGPLDDPTTCVFGLRRMHPDVMRQITEAHTTRTEPKLPGEAPSIEVDRVAEEKDMLDYIIQYWRGPILLPDGSPAPCTRDGKWTLPGNLKSQIYEATGVTNLGGNRSSLKNWSAPSAPPAPEGASTTSP